MDEIRCHDCSVTLGTVTVPSGAALKEKAGNSVDPMTAGLLSMLPNNIAEVLLPFIIFRCPTCTTKEIFHNGSKEENRQEVNAEAQRNEAWNPFRRRKSDGAKE